MYDNRFGMYPSDDMNDNINSYFGESDTNFFADNSNEQIFGEGFMFDGYDDFGFFMEAANKDERDQGDYLDKHPDAGNSPAERDTLDEVYSSRFKKFNDAYDTWSKSSSSMDEFDKMSAAEKKKEIERRKKGYDEDVRPLNDRVEKAREHAGRSTRHENEYTDWQIDKKSKNHGKRDWNNKSESKK